MFKNGLAFTRSLVLFSILASFGSFYTLHKGWGEIYPFCTYKLYSQPSGTKHTFTEYRIYSKPSRTAPFKRNAVYATNIFSSDEYVYTLNFFVDQTLKDTLHQTDHKKKLLLFVKYVVPDQAAYKIVSETYHPMHLLKNGSYDTSTVVVF